MCVRLIYMVHPKLYGPGREQDHKVEMIRDGEREWGRGGEIYKRASEKRGERDGQ